MSPPKTLCIALMLLPLVFAQVEYSSFEVLKDDKEVQGDIVVEGGETLRVAIRAYNLGDNDVEDILLRVEIDELDLVAESKVYDIEKKQRFEAQLQLPYVLEDPSYEIEVSLEDEKGDIIYHEQILPLKVREHTHLVRIVESDIFPQTVRCGEDVRVRAKVVNLGKKEEYLRVFFGSEELRSSALSEELRLKASDSEYEVSTVLRISESTLTGEYGVDIVPRYPGARKDKEAHIVKVPVVCKEKNKIAPSAPQPAHKVIRLDPAPKVIPTAHMVYTPYDEIVTYAQRYAVELLVLTLLLGLLTLSVLFTFIE